MKWIIVTLSVILILAAQQLESQQPGQQGREQPDRNQQRRNRLPEGTVVARDIAYVENGHERQKLDLFLPAKDGSPDALIVWVHGGAWRAGDKRNCPALFLMDRGFAVASINYRYSEHATFPAQIEDCKAAVRWLRDSSNDHETDADRIGVWGSSAGGHLVAMLGTSGDVAALGDKTEMTSSRVQAVCDYFGPIDFSRMNEQAGENSAMDHDAKDSPEALLIGGPVQENADKVKLANPSTYIDETDPPFLIVHGEKDRLVSVRQSREFHAALKEAKIDSELVIVPDAGHGQFRDKEIIEKVAEFFEEKLASDK